jgi:hypothetical protein
VGQLSRTRCRSTAKLARPYICRFKSLNLVLVPVAAENPVTACDLHVLVYEAAEPVSS